MKTPDSFADLSASSTQFTGLALPNSMRISPSIETVFAREMTREDALAIGSLIVKVWPKPEVTVEQRADKVQGEWGTVAADQQLAKRSLIVRHDDHVIAHACLFPRTISTTQGDLTIAALSLVCTDPDCRGQNLGVAIVREAFRLVDNQLFPFALFQTSQRASSFYERLGCAVVENKVVDSTADDTARCPFKDDLIMRYPAARDDWPTGDIDLCGPGY